MRILTRGDADGLLSTVLLTLVEDIREIRFAHPKDVQDGLVDATEEDIVVNIPHVPGCGLWFDHHISEDCKLNGIGEFKGSFKVSPSAAHVIWDYYNSPKFEPLKDMLVAIDKLDSANLEIEEILNPQGWILLGLTLDPRTGLGPEFRKYFRWMVEYIKELPIDKVLKHPEVKKRCDRVLHEQEEFRKILEKSSRQDGNVIITDLRGMYNYPVGNRFIIYTLYPEANVELRLFNGHNGRVVVAAGHSIFNRTCNVSCGELLAKYGGGGHAGAGTCQIPEEEADAKIAEIVEIFKKNEP